MKHLILLTLTAGALCYGQATTSSGTINTGSTIGTVGSSTGTGVFWNGNLNTTTLITTTAGNQLLYSCDATGRCSSTNTQPVAPRKKSLNPATLAMVKSSAKPLDKAILAPASYITLAKSVGLDPSVSSDEASIMSAINTLKLPVYNFALVDDYLYNKAIEHGKDVRWVWKPMRYKDLQEIVKTTLIPPTAMEKTGVMDYVQYSRELPVEVLQTVKDFLCEFADASFYVSDYSTVKPDPFLAVSTPRLLAEGKIWIIQVWSEPGFAGTPTHISIGKDVASLQ